MKVSFDKSFHKRLIRIQDKQVLAKVKQAILHAEEAGIVQQIPNIRKLEGFKTFYRIRVGDYRIGIELRKDTISFITIADRKEIYKRFP